MRALIVGAGAVGLVYGRHLAKGGADVSFLVKPKHEAACRAGFTMYPLNERGAPAHRFEGFGILTDPSQAAGSTWDQVWLAVPSSALREGDWLAPLARATGDATIVFLPPNIDDRALLEGLVRPERIVDGIIGFIAYAAPLPGETRFAAPGMAYWSPPLSPSPFSGPRARVDAVVAALRKGGLGAVRKHDVMRSLPFLNAILYGYLAALELADWSFAKLREGDRLANACRAAREAMAIGSHAVGRPVPLHLRIASSSLLVRIGSRFAPWFVPLPLEPYLRAHFTKIGGQVRIGLQSYLELGTRAGLPTDALAKLTRALPPAQ
jgi:ketopantoate reductase